MVDPAVDFSNYSLFVNERTLADFAPIPSNGIYGLLAQLHLCASTDPQCCSSPVTCLHPDGSQISFTLGSYMLILMTRSAVADHYFALKAAGNSSSKLALRALSQSH